MTNTRNTFITYFRMCLYGFFVGSCFGQVILWSSTKSQHPFFITTLFISAVVLLWILLKKYDWHILFGIALSVGMATLCSTMAFGSPNHSDKFSIFAMVFVVFFIQYIFMMLLRKSILQIVEKHKQNTKNKK